MVFQSIQKNISAFNLKKNIAILGSTGSIGTQALEVIDAFPDEFSIEVLTAMNNAELLIAQAKHFVPNAVVIGNEALYPLVFAALDPFDIKVYAGKDAFNQVVEMENIDMVLTSMVGFAGLEPTLRAIEAGKHIALANKETLVVAGELITQKAAEKKVGLFPVDSEHSAIFQCLAGEYLNPIEKIILTASGGPFRGKNAEQLKTITKADALRHPNWDMGNKITIDSATLMNKGLEVIEARWLFGVKPEEIEVIVHPQSIIHSMLQFTDGSIKAQMGLPDMKLPILYALSFPKRLNTSFKRFSFADYQQLTFEQPDIATFRCLQLAYEAMRLGGNMPCILNAANEIAVEAFLNDHINFLQIPEVIEQSMQKAAFLKKPLLADYLASNQETRIITSEIIQQIKTT
ncbi:MAG: 1-deoxy-D-xylulose-5-phosphate reductoisomerase [Bacteroidota bacterium]